MTFPQQAPGFPQQQGYGAAPSGFPQQQNGGFPAQPQQGYGGQPGGFPQPPQGQTNGYPQGYGQPQGQWGPPQQPGGYPQQYGAPAAPQAPQQQPASGSLSDFFKQPTVGGGKSINLNPGEHIYGVVSREMGDGDVEHATKYQPPGSSAPAELDYHRDGRAKLNMRIPLQVEPSQNYPDGHAVLIVQGAKWTELARAMAAVGLDANTTPPEKGAVIGWACTGYRQTTGSPAKVYQCVYQRPEGAGQSTGNGQAQQVPQQPAAPVAEQQSPPQAQAQAAPGLGQVQQAFGGQVPQQGQASPFTQQVAQQDPTVAAAFGGQQGQGFPGQQVPQQGQPGSPDLDSQRQALLARLTNQGAPAQG